MLSLTDFGGFRPSTPWLDDLFLVLERRSVNVKNCGGYSTDKSDGMFSSVDYKLRNRISSGEEVSNGLWSGNTRFTRSFLLFRWKTFLNPETRSSFVVKHGTSSISNLRQSTTKLISSPHCQSSRETFRLSLKLSTNLETIFALENKKCFSEQRTFLPSNNERISSSNWISDGNIVKEELTHKPSWIPLALLPSENRLKFICWPLGFASRLFSLSQGCLLTRSWRKILRIPRPFSALLGELERLFIDFWWMKAALELLACLKGVDDENLAVGNRKSHQIAFLGSLSADLSTKAHVANRSGTSRLARDLSCTIKRK